MSRAIAIAVAFLLAGCGITPDDIKFAEVVCQSHGGPRFIGRDAMQMSATIRCDDGFWLRGVKR